MNLRQYFYLSFLIPVLTLLLLGTSPAQTTTEKATGIKSPFLWSIGDENPSFIFGTIHLPDPKVTTLPDSVKEAIKASDAVYTEIDMGSGSILSMSQKLMLPPDQKLSTILPKDVYARLDAYLKERGLPVVAFEQIKPWAVASQLALLDYLPQLMTSQPQDAVINKLGTRYGKETGALETAEQQMAIFDSLTQEEQVKFLDDSLKQLEDADKDGSTPIQDLLETYLEGNEDELIAYVESEFDPQDPLDRKLLKRLITDRDKSMSESIDELIKANPQKNYFFAVGALHLPTEFGIVNRLQEMGYKMERIEE